MTRPAHTAPTRAQLVRSLSECLGMIKCVGFDDDCEAATKRLWKSEVKRLTAILARAKEPRP